MKDGWFQALKKDKGTQLSELAVLLKAIDRFFVLENLAISDYDNPERNFYDELLIVREVILRIVALIEQLLPEDEKNSYWFKKYAEQRFMSVSTRDTLREELYRQDSPEKGLLLLYDTFVNIKTVVSDMIRSQNIPYISFKNLGDILSREIRENKYFNPFRKSIDIEEDRIDNPVIAEVVNGINDRDTRRYTSLVIVMLYRLLRILRYVITDSSIGGSRGNAVEFPRAVEQAVLMRSIAILFLIRNELEELRGILEIAGEKLEKSGNKELSNLFMGLSYQIAMETKRIYLQELKDITKRSSYKRYRGRLENSWGMLKNLLEQCILQIAQKFKPDLRGEELFPAFITKKQASVKLREDIAVMHRIVSAILENPSIGDSRGDLRLLVALRDYIHYFQSFTYRLLRYDDYEEFSNFIDDVLKYINRIKPAQRYIHTAETPAPDSHKNSGGISDEWEGKGIGAVSPLPVRFIERLSHFKIFLETIIRQVSQREELSGEPLDEERVKTIMQNFL